MLPCLAFERNNRERKRACRKEPMPSASAACRSSRRHGSTRGELTPRVYAGDAWFKVLKRNDPGASHTKSTAPSALPRIGTGMGTVRGAALPTLPPPSPAQQNEAWRARVFPRWRVGWPAGRRKVHRRLGLLTSAARGKPHVQGSARGQALAGPSSGAVAGNPARVRRSTALSRWYRYSCRLRARWGATAAERPPSSGHRCIVRHLGHVRAAGQASARARQNQSA